MFKKKWLLSILGLLILTAGMLIFLFLPKNPAFEASLEAKPPTIRALAPDEKPIRGKSYQEGKLSIVTLTYKNISSEELTDIQVVLQSEGSKIIVAAQQYAKFRSSLPNGDNIYDAARSLQPGQDGSVNFFIYSKEPGSVILKAEVVSKENKKVITKPTILKIINL